MDAVAKPIVSRRPRKSRAKFADLFDLSDERERHVRRCLVMLNHGGEFVPVEFGRCLQLVAGKPHRFFLAIIRIAPHLRDRGIAWNLLAWDLDGPGIVARDMKTRKAASAALRAAAAN